MSKVIRYTLKGQEQVSVMNGSVPSDPVALKVLVANYLAAPHADREKFGPDATVEELVDSRLKAAGVTAFEILDR
ncbi:hypothetical protein ACFPU0_02955 [Pseudomonas sp. GCM10022186]|uniref:hypothetical protein n=1 Tax=Pseudomonas sp. GCM10022186 TaxID=3252650 RepID=UPI0028B34F1C